MKKTLKYMFEMGWNKFYLWFLQFLQLHKIVEFSLIDCAQCVYMLPVLKFKA